MMKNSNSILFERSSEGVGLITFNREKTRNALSPEMIADLLVCLRSAEADSSTRVVIITGAGRGFCSGADLTGGLLEDNIHGVEDWINDEANPVIDCIRSMTKPVIAAVNGVAAGAGFSIALACDLVIAANSARFILSFANINMAMDLGASWFLTRKIGPMRTAALAMSAQPLDVPTAQQWGIVYESVEDTELLLRAQKFANLLALMPDKALAAIKSQINCATNATLEESLRYEAKLQGELVQTEETQKLVRQFSAR